MPRKAGGARLYQRGNGVWYIRDTGCPEKTTGTRDRRDAEKALAAYIALKGSADRSRHPSQLSVAEALDIYGREHAEHVASPERIGYAIEALLPFWADLTVEDVKGATCRRYVQSRVRRFKDGREQPISAGTTRRELNVLQAAINYCHKEGYITSPVRVTLPAPPGTRERWLTRDEAAALIWAAWRSPKGAKHVARFILISLYTGTRKDSVLRLGLLENTVGGWIDVERGVMYRRGAGERITNKRRKPVRLPRRLLAHVERWQRMGMRWAVEDRGARVGDIKKGFAGAVARAGLDGVTPHTLKHTAITWCIQRGMSDHDAADYFDTSVETVRRTYYHHSPFYQDGAVEVLDRRG